MEYRATVSSGEGMEFVLSDGSMDRHGTRLNPNGWDITNFKKNPIALFAHSSAAPIGTWENVRVVKDRLIGRLALASEGTSARIDELRRLVEQGILRAVSVGFNVLKAGTPGKSGFDLEEMELVEASLVSIPSNTNALASARALNISDSTIRMVFGEHAEQVQRAVSPGKNAAKSPVVIERPKAVTTLSQRIEGAQTDLNAKRDKLVELSGTDAADLDAINELNGQIETAERTIAILKVSEQRLAGITPSGAAAVAAPAVLRRPLGIQAQEVRASDLLWRKAAVKLISYDSGQRDLGVILERLYPNHQATAAVTRADATIGTTTTAGWASELIQSGTGEFLNTLKPDSILPDLMSMGTSLVFNNSQGSIKLPSRVAGTNVNGDFVLEGDPIPVRRLATTSVTLTPRKMAVISTFSKELAKYSTPTIESLLRSEMSADTAVTLDTRLLDATAGSATRPAGLLNGVAAVAGGFGGGDHQAFLADVAALMAPFDSANAGRNMALIMHPSQRRKLQMMPGPDGTLGWHNQLLTSFRILTSTSATAGRLIAVDAADFAAAYGGIEFDVSEQATLHMSDAPAEIVTAAGAVADPIRSLFQTASVAVRMMLDVTWAMRRTGMVQWIDGTSY